jgi:lactoylglutathione lyase
MRSTQKNGLLVVSVALVLGLALGITAHAENDTAQSRVGLVGLNVSDLDRAVDFYTNVIGMKEVRRYGDGFGRIGIFVTDAQTIVENVSASGGEVIREPHTFEDTGAVLAFVKDPFGYAIEIIQQPR